MLKIEDGNIYLTRGDSATLEVTIKDDEGNDWSPSAGDKVIFSMKRAAINPEPILTIEAAPGDTDIIIAPANTVDLTCGIYIYDIHVKLAGGDVYTVIADKSIEIGKEAHTSWS
jgi:hypothetical protein